MACPFSMMPGLANMKPPHPIIGGDGNADAGADAKSRSGGVVLGAGSDFRTTTVGSGSESAPKYWHPTNLDPDVKHGDIVGAVFGNFKWNDRLHRKGADLEKLRSRGDKLADAALIELDQLGHYSDALDSLLAVHKKRRDLTAKTEMQIADEQSAIFAMVESILSVPKWIDLERLRQGQRVFKRYSECMNISLLHCALSSGFGFRRINFVLTSTNYLVGNNTRRRLFETSKMVHDCMGQGNMTPGSGAGWASAVRVRLLHARVRQRLRKSSVYKSADSGVPINQEDMAVTLCAFSIVILESLERVGVTFTRQEQESYIYLWRVIGFYMGIDDDVNPCTSMAHSLAYLESVTMHLFDPDETSRFLTQNVLRAVANQPPSNAPYEAHATIARLMMGEKIADILQLPPPKAATVRRFRFLIRLWSLRAAVCRQIQWIDTLVGEFNLRMAVRLLAKELGTNEFKFSLSHAPNETDVHLSHAAIQDALLAKQDIKPQQRSLTFAFILSVGLTVLFSLVVSSKYFRYPVE